MEQERRLYWKVLFPRLPSNHSSTFLVHIKVLIITLQKKVEPWILLYSLFYVRKLSEHSIYSTIIIIIILLLLSLLYSLLRIANNWGWKTKKEKRNEPRNVELGEDTNTCKFCYCYVLAHLFGDTWKSRFFFILTEQSEK